MIRTAVALGVLIFSVLFLPVWVQAVLFVVAIVVVRYRLVLLIAPLLADVLYSPQMTLTFPHFKMTFIALAVLFLYWFIVTNTRIRILYARSI